MRTDSRMIMRVRKRSYESNSWGKLNNFANYRILQKHGLRQKHRQVTTMFAQRIED